jgi:hypothetical protein
LRVCDEKHEPNGFCATEDRLLQALKPKNYNHHELGRALQSYINFGMTNDSAFHPLYNKAKAIYTEMQMEIFDQLDRLEGSTNSRRAVGFFVLCIALGVRIAKLTAETFGWHLPKPVVTEPLRLPIVTNQSWPFEFTKHSSGRRT